MTDFAQRHGRRALSAAAIATLSFAHPLAAQQDSAATVVTYRTRDIVFVAAGRADRLAVGDTLLITTAAGAPTAAVVVSLAQRTASARLAEPAVTIATGARAAWRPRAAEPAAANAPLPRRDTAAALEAPRPRRAPRVIRTPVLRGSIQLEQSGTSGGSARLSTSQTIGMASLRVAPVPGVELRLRTTTRRRAGQSAALTAADQTETTVYQAELALGTDRSRWALGVGRFVPPGAMALGYLDGARIELRLSRAQRVGAVAGFVPDAVKLEPSSATRRAGAYWSFGGGATLYGTVAAAADWAQGERRRTQLAAQSSWAPLPALTFSLYADADLGAPWDTAGARLTNLYAATRARLPLGFRAGLGVESHQAVRLWELFVPGDTTPLPGRLTGVTFSLGHDLAGFAVDGGGAWLQRQGEPGGTMRANLSASRRALFLSGSYQTSDLLDYGSIMGRVVLPRRLPVTASFGVLASFMKPGAMPALWRVSFRPELSRAVGARWYATAGGDIGRYAGAWTTWLHGGVSYRFDR